MQVQKGTNKIISFNKDMPLTKFTTKPWECIGDTLQLVRIIEISIETRKEKNKKQKQVLGLCDRFVFLVGRVLLTLLMLVDYIDYFPASMASIKILFLKGLIFKSHNKNAFMWDLLKMLGQNPKPILPNDDLMVIYHDTIRKKSPKKINPWPFFGQVWTFLTKKTPTPSNTQGVPVFFLSSGLSGISTHSSAFT